MEEGPENAVDEPLKHIVDRGSVREHAPHPHPPTTTTTTATTIASGLAALGPGDLVFHSHRPISSLYSASVTTAGCPFDTQNQPHCSRVSTNSAAAATTALLTGPAAGGATSYPLLFTSSDRSSSSGSRSTFSANSGIPDTSTISTSSSTGGPFTPPLASHALAHYPLSPLGGSPKKHAPAPNSKSSSSASKPVAPAASTSPPSTTTTTAKQHRCERTGELVNKVLYGLTRRRPAGSHPSGNTTKGSQPDHRRKANKRQTRQNVRSGAASGSDRTARRGGSGGGSSMSGGGGSSSRRLGERQDRYQDWQDSVAVMDLPESSYSGVIPSGSKATPSSSSRRGGGGGGDEISLRRGGRKSIGHHRHTRGGSADGQGLLAGGGKVSAGSSVLTGSAFDESGGGSGMRRPRETPVARAIRKQGGLPCRETTIELPITDYAFVETTIIYPTTQHEPSNPLARATNRLAILLHPWSRLGGQRDDPVLLSMLSTFLSRDFHIILYNSRGVGNSGGRTSFSGLDEVKDLETIVDLALREIEMVDEIVLFGYSFGSMIAAMHPARLAYASATNPHVLPELKIRHVLLSYPLSVMWFLTFFHQSTYTKGLKDLLKDPSADVLVIFGDRDNFTKLAKYEAWANELREIAGKQEAMDAGSSLAFEPLAPIISGTAESAGVTTTPATKPPLSKLSSFASAFSSIGTMSTSAPSSSISSNIHSSPISSADSPVLQRTVSPSQLSPTSSAHMQQSSPPSPVMSSSAYPPPKQPTKSSKRRVRRPQTATRTTAKLTVKVVPGVDHFWREKAHMNFLKETTAAWLEGRPMPSTTYDGSGADSMSSAVSGGSSGGSLLQRSVTIDDAPPRVSGGGSLRSKMNAATKLNSTSGSIPASVAVAASPSDATVRAPKRS